MLFKKVNKQVISVILAVVLIFALTGCGSTSSNQEDAPSTPVATVKEPIKIGMVQPLSGSAAFDGQQLVQGAKLYIEELNKAGGILGGHPVELVIEDTATEPSQGVAAAEKLVSKGDIIAILGAFNSSVTGAVAPVTEKAGIPLVAAIPTSPNLTEQGHKFFFRMTGTSQLFADAFAEKVLNDFNAKRIAFIYENGDFGRNSTKAFKEAIVALGGTALTEQIINEGDQDIYTQMTAIKDTKPDAIYACANTANAARITNTASELGLTPNVKIFGEGVWASQKYLELTGKNSEGVYTVVEYIDCIESELNKKFVEAYKAKYNVLPEKTGAGGYRIAQALTSAIENAGSVDGKVIADTFRQMTFETATGTYKFDEKGQAHGFDMYLAQIKDGKPIIAAVAKVK